MESRNVEGVSLADVPREQHPRKKRSATEPSDQLINAGKAQERHLSARRRSRICIMREIGISLDSDLQPETRKESSESEELRTESCERSRGEWMACRAHGRIMNRSPCFPFPCAPRVLWETCIRMENPRLKRFGGVCRGASIGKCR